MNTSTYDFTDIEISVEYKTGKYQEKIDRYFREGCLENLINTESSPAKCWNTIIDGYQHIYFQFGDEVIRYITDSHISFDFMYMNADVYKHILTLNSVNNMILKDSLKTGDIVLYIDSNYYLCSDEKCYKLIGNPVNLEVYNTVNTVYENITRKELIKLLPNHSF